jgi:hypothetical protein
MGPDTDLAPRAAGQALNIDPKKICKAAKVDPSRVIATNSAGTPSLHVVTFYQFGEFS